ncbi:hypothetical protein RUM44_008874 [Polyplax serrata]|uniref:Uncharacterized protein n=1 Tax=Polyplax serrata TaxID=468196 RepID=A0ABR1BBP9_POLSC
MKYFVVISLPKIHSHPIQVRGQYLNDEVKAAMHYVLRTGTTSLSSIQEKVYEIVDREFENHPIKPSRENSAFYPNQKTIYNHLRRDGLIMSRLYKKNGSDVTCLKAKTKDLLSLIFQRLEGCSDIIILTKVYKKCKNLAITFASDTTEGDAIQLK